MEFREKDEVCDELALALEEQELNERRIERLAGLLERKSGVDLERAIVVDNNGSMKNYTAKEWLTTKGWFNGEGKAQLDAIGTKVNEVYELKDEHVFSSLLEFDKTVHADEAQLQKIKEELAETQPKYEETLKSDEDAAKIIKEYLDGLQKDQADVEASIQRLNEARATVMKDFGDLAAPAVRASGTGAESEGNALSPNVLVASYPGISRQHLFRILKLQLCLDMSSEGDCYVMSEKVKTITGKAAFPGSWTKELGSTAAWKDFTAFLVTLKDDTGAEVFKAGGVAPAWFVDEWGPAAFHAASAHGSAGSGVVVFKGWKGYRDSQWCQLEFLFSRCLAQKFPQSVYMVTGYDVLTKKSLGAYMTGDEAF